MEQTRHFVTTVFIANGSKSLLHNHKKLDSILPPGGHIDRDELPHKAARREVKEETGLEIQFNTPTQDDLPSSKWSKPIPQPNHTLLDDITITDGTPSHQHINFIYFAETDTEQITPQGEDEVSADNWYWVQEEQLRNNTEPFSIDPLVRELCLRSIQIQK